MTARKKGSFWTFADRFEGDKVVWIIVLLLFLISIVCMFSSSSRLLSGSTTRLDMVKEQLMVVLAGLAVVIVLYNIKSIKFFRICSSLGFGISLLLLLLLDLRVRMGSFLVAKEINGAYRVLSIEGIQIHVFEIVKVAMVMYLAWAIDMFKHKRLPGKGLSEIWQKIIYIYLPFLIVFVMILVGSNSSAIIVGGIMFIVILLGGGNFRDMSLLLLSGIVIVGICTGIYKLSDGRAMKRIGTGISRIFEDEDLETKFLNSAKGTVEYQDALDAMRQPYSAKIAVHEGGLLGKGPGQSTQRYMVPDYSEDYMYSFIIEEYGLLGGILVIFIYISLLARGSIIVRGCGNDLYAKLCVAGLCILISGQAFLHMFVNADIGPMTGQTLPLVSHGTSAFLCFCVAFGVILSFSRIAARRIEKETREAAPLVEMHDNVEAGLNELDAFESGTMSNEDYGI
jgi:cell division protein FtsW